MREEPFAFARDRGPARSSLGKPTMANTETPTRARRQALFIDQLVVAAEAIEFGSTEQAHWETLLSFARRHGLDDAAQLLASVSAPSGATREWWRCALLLRSDLSPDQAPSVLRELSCIEAVGGGPSFDIERHALQVAQAIDVLRAHLERVHMRVAAVAELRGIEPVLRAVRAARAAAGAEWKVR